MTTTNTQRWLYALAHLGIVLTVQAFSAYVLFYYVDVKHLNATWAANVMTVYAFYNAFNNPLMGYISDRTRSRWGRRLPYILFGTGPLALCFLLVWLAPFDGIVQAVPLLIYFIVIIFIWEALYTLVSTGYYALLPEMFASYHERTDAGARMQLVQTIGLIVGIALPPLLYSTFGWPAMGALFAAVAAAALWIGARGMFERPDYMASDSLPLLTALKETLVNRSFVALVAAQTLRFVGTFTLTAGMAFYVKYSLGLPEGQTSLVFATVFIAAMPAMWLWRWIARRVGARTTLMLAYGAFGVGALPLAIVTSLASAIATAALIGVGLAGMLLMGDVILCDVIDEDELRTGRRREGMYFGLSGMIIFLSQALAAVVFGWVTSAYGYNSALAVQPDSVAAGFRVYMTVPTFVGAALAIVALAFYPLHGARLAQVKAELAARQSEIPQTP